MASAIGSCEDTGARLLDEAASYGGFRVLNHIIPASKSSHPPASFDRECRSDLAAAYSELEIGTRAPRDPLAAGCRRVSGAARIVYGLLIPPMPKLMAVENCVRWLGQAALGRCTGSGAADMGMIVEFRQQPGRMVAPAQAMSGKSAEIVIFPGVRIERWSEPQPQSEQAAPKTSGPAAGGKGRSKRR